MGYLMKAYLNTKTKRAGNVGYWQSVLIMHEPLGSVTNTAKEGREEKKGRIQKSQIQRQNAH